MCNLTVNARFLCRAPTGVDRTATELLSALMANGESPPIRILRPADPVVEPAARPRQVLERAEMYPARGRWPLGGQLWEQLALLRIDPDDWLLSLCNMGPVLRRRQIVMIHDAQVFRTPGSYARTFRLWYRFAQPRLGRSAARVLTVSEHSRNELVRFGIAPAERIIVIPNGADHVLRIAPGGDTLARHGLEAGGYLLAIGALAPHKNLAFAAAAAAARPRGAMPLVIAGGGNPAVFRSAGLHDGPGLRVLGRVSDPDLRALYDHARALIFPSLTEGFGLPAAEAMACGCPVIASNRGAVPEVTGDAALLLDPEDRAGWTDAMERIACDDSLASHLISAGRERAGGFTWARSAGLLIDMLADLRTH